MGEKGFEPLQPYGHWILSPTCIPFHHSPKNPFPFSILFLEARTGIAPVYVVLSRKKFLEVAVGVAPTHRGFADRSLSYLGTPPKFLRDPAPNVVFLRRNSSGSRRTSSRSFSIGKELLKKNPHSGQTTSLNPLG